MPCVLWYTAWEQASHPSQPQWGCASFLSLLPLGSGACTQLCAEQVSDPLPGHLALTASGFTPTPSSWGFRVFLEGSLGRERPSPAFPGQELADSTAELPGVLESDRAEFKSLGDLGRAALSTSVSSPLKNVTVTRPTSWYSHGNLTRY